MFYAFLGLLYFLRTCMCIQYHYKIYIYIIYIYIYNIYILLLLPCMKMIFYVHANMYVQSKLPRQQLKCIPQHAHNSKNMLDQLGFNYWPPAIRGMLTPTTPTLRQTMRHKGMHALWNTASSAAEAASRHGYHMLSHVSIIISQILRIGVPSHEIFGYVLGGEVCLQEVD